MEMLELAEKNGWKATELDNYDFHKRSMETWRLESVWSPVGKTAYVSFLIDPMSDFQNPYAWAIEISNEMPRDREQRNRFVASLKHWKNEKEDFFKFLSDIRSQDG